jgi:hypothetical protein
MNLFGADVSALDVPTFLAAARHLFALAALAWLALLLKLRSPRWLLLGVLLANAWVWAETTWPLQRLYALGPSSDRLNNVAMAQNVAAGRSPLAVPQVETINFEPLWAALVGVLSGFSPDRLLLLYAWMPLLAVTAVALSFYAALRPLPGSEVGEGWSPWERALVAAGATLLASDALDFTGPYRVPWAMTFMLKPNHVLALVLAPWVARRFAAIAGTRDRLRAGLLLHLLAWAFVVHMAVFALGLVLLVALSWRFAPAEWRRDLEDASVVIGVNLLVVSPYLVLLLFNYGVFETGLGARIATDSPHLLEPTARVAVPFLLAVWGAAVAWRRDRLGRVWAALLAGACAAWVAFLPLHLLQLAKEKDDVYFWLRTLVGVLAAVGAWDVLRRAVEAGAALHAAAGRLQPAHVRAALAGLLALPLCAPFWWDPSRMDSYFEGSREPLPEAMTGVARALRELPEGVVTGDPWATRWVAALTGRQILIAAEFPGGRNAVARWGFTKQILWDEPGWREVAERYDIRYLLVTRRLLTRYGVSLEDIRDRPWLAVRAAARDPEGQLVVLFEIQGAGT